MKRLFFATILCLAFGLNGFAQQNAETPATKEDVEKYLEVTHAPNMMKQMMEAMSKPIHQMNHEQCLKEKDNLPADCEAHMNKFLDDTLQQMPFDEMLQAMVPVYQKHLTKGDIEALLAFYSSPTGQKMLREMPAMTADAMESAMPVMRKFIDRVTDQLQQEVKRLKESKSKSS